MNNPLQRITTLEQLRALVWLKKSVCVPNAPCWSKPLPAAFMIHQSGEILLRLFETGMYVYQPKGKSPS